MMKMMKTLFRVLLVGFLAIGFTAATASASTCSFGTDVEITAGTDTDTQQTICLEAVTGASLVANYYTLSTDQAANSPLGNAIPANVGDKIGFEASWGMNSGDIITITFTNALYMDGDCYLIAEEAIGQQTTVGLATDFDMDGDVLDVVEIASNFGTVDIVNGVTSITMRVNNGLNLPTGTQMHLVNATTACEQDLDAAIDNDTENPTFKFLPTVTNGAEVNMSVSAVTVGGIAIGAAACNADIFEFETQFNFAVTTPGTSVIDVEAVAGNRWNFVEEGAATDVITSVNDTDLIVSGCTYTYTNDLDSSIEDFYTLTGTDTLVMTLTTSTDFSQVNVAGNLVYAEMADDGAPAGDTGITDDTNVVFATATATTLTNTYAGNLIDLEAPEGFAFTDDVVITVLGTGIINARSYTLGATLNLVTGLVASEESPVFAATTSHTWTTNGSQFVIPHMFSRNGWETYAVLKSQYNQSSSTVTVDLLAKDGTYAPNLVFGTLLPASTGTGAADGGSLYISAAELMTLAGWTASGLDKDFSAVITLTVPNDQIQADAYRYSDGQFFNATLYQKKNYGGGTVTAQWEK